jgi:sirohydrochlorin ferrochelatase
MTANRRPNAWIWIAVAAIVVTTMARAEATLPKAAALTHPVLEFLSAHTGEAYATVTIHRSGRSASVRRTSHSDEAGAWAVLVPIFFIGLIAPLSLISARATLALGIASQTPVLSSLFQRPPPSFGF